MTRAQGIARALAWSILVLGPLLLVMSLPPLRSVWETRAAEAGEQAGPTTTTTAAATSTSVATTAPATTQPPTTAPATTTPPIATTLAPPITVGPPVTLPPGTRVSTSVDGTTSSTEEPAVTTTLPELLVPAPPDSRPDTTTSSLPDDEGDSGMAPSTKLSLAVGGLLAAAAVIGALTVVYFVKTRPVEGVPDEDAGYAHDGIEEPGPGEPGPGGDDDHGVVDADPAATGDDTAPVGMVEPGPATGPVAEDPVPAPVEAAPVGGIAALAQLLSAGEPVAPEADDDSADESRQ